MYKLTTIVFAFGISWHLFALEMPKYQPHNKVTLFSGALLRDDIDYQRSYHYQNGAEYSLQLSPYVLLGTLATYSLDRNFQARESYLHENFYNVHFTAMLSYSYFVRVSLGGGISLRTSESKLGIGGRQIYRVWQYGVGALARVLIDYAFSPRWEASYSGMLELRQQQPQVRWRYDTSHLFGLGWRF